MKYGVNDPCPCQSGKKYKRCCRPAHEGQAPATAEATMRSRYCAYALGRVEYLLTTTHPGGPHWEADTEAWRAEIRRFCEATTFQGLEVEAVEAGEETSRVLFRATLAGGGRTVILRENSLFLRQGGRWLYHSGERQPT